MTSQIPFTPLTPGAMERLTLDEQLAFLAAAGAVAGDQKPSLEVIATLVLTVQRLAAGRPGTATGPAEGNWREHAERAEAQLAAVEDFCRTSAGINYGLVKAGAILAITGTGGGKAVMADGDLPEHVRRAAEAAHRNWRIGDDGEGRLHAALVVAASLIRADERERIAKLAEAGDVTVWIDEDGDGIAVGIPFADLIREPS